MKHRVLAILTPLLLVAALGISTIARAELPVIDGEHWTASDSESKLAFLMGMATMIKIEQNLLGDPPPPGTVSFAPALAKGIGDMTLTEVMNRVDALYADNPDRMDESVVTLIWQEIVIPRIEANE